MKTLWITITAILALTATATAQSAQEAKNPYEVTAYQMNIINETLWRILPALGTENIFSILITRLDESGEELPEQQLVQVNESVRMNYAAASVPPPEACLTRFTKAQTWYDNGTFLRNYLCQHPNYNGPLDGPRRNLRHDIYWGTSTDFFNTADDLVECMVNNLPNPALNTFAFQKLCFARIN